MTRREALEELLRFLKAAKYEFVAVAPSTHAKVLSRPTPRTLSTRDIFGWNRAFDSSDASAAVIALLQAADALDTSNGKLRSKIRVASLGDDLLLHSAYPTDDIDAVFFGPDTYRFTRFIEQKLPQIGAVNWLVDMGAGSGAGAIAAAKLREFATVTMIDTNAAALEFAAINAAVAGVRAETSVADAIPHGPDLVVANPPYMMDKVGRSYRDGGRLMGGEVALNWAKQAMACLAARGAMLLYTGAAYVNGEAPLAIALGSACAKAGFDCHVIEIDPDVFGDELSQPQYASVERIAALGMLIRASK